MKALAIKFALTLLRALGWLPLWLLDALGRALGATMWHLKMRERAVTEINLSLCFPHLSTDERERLARASLRDFGRNAFGMLHAWFASPERVLATIDAVEGLEVLDEALAAGKGVIVLAPHLGNWEALGLWLGRRCHITNMYLPARRNIEFANAVLAARTRDGASIAPADAGGVRAVLKILKGGGVVGILPDQEPKLAGAEPAPFYGRQVMTMTLVSNLLARTGARAVFATALRQPRGHRFKLVFRPAGAALYEADQAQSLAALNRGVEQMIALAPEQYQWEYKRFKARLPGQTDPYRDDR